MQQLRKNLNIMLVGVSSADSEPVISLLRAARMSPRAVSADALESISSTLRERTWDLILFNMTSNLDVKALGELLKTNNKDIPLILLSPDDQPENRINGLRNRASAVVSIQEKELLVLIIRRELFHLENRRRRRKAEYLLIETERRCRDLLHSSSESIGYLNKAMELVFVNPSFVSHMGYNDSKDLLGKPLSYITRNQEETKLNEFLEDYNRDTSINQEIDITATRPDGSEFNASLHFSGARFERSSCIQVILHTPHEDAVMESLAEQDLVTGLKNQLFLAKKLDQAVQAAVRAGHDVNLLYITLDNFNAIKAEIGVNGADAIVRDVASLLQKSINRAHILTRYNLDAFTIIFADSDSKKAVALAEKICQAVAANLTEIAGAKIQTTCSIGVTPITSDSPSAHEVLRLGQQASEAVRSKNQRGNGVHLFVPEERDDDDDGLSVKKLRTAIQNNNFKLLFQPVVSLHGEHDHIYEVLLRLIDRDDNQVSPNMFLTMLDHAEVSTELDRWVISEAIQQLAETQKKGTKNKLFINLTGRSLEDPRLLQWIAEQLRDNAVSGDSLIFQFSESDASSYLKYANMFTQGLVQLHASACIKHYGSSIDSENVLRHIPAEFIKLDGSFVQELEDPEKHEAFDKLVEPLRIGHKTVIAPLVEGTTVMSKLWRSGIHYIQGYYLQAPREHMDYDFFNES